MVCTTARRKMPDVVEDGDTSSRWQRNRQLGMLAAEYHQRAHTSAMLKVELTHLDLDLRLRSLCRLPLLLEGIGDRLHSWLKEFSNVCSVREFECQ